VGPSARYTQANTAEIAFFSVQQKKIAKKFAEVKNSVYLCTRIQGDNPTVCS
jgi:hypothetical protein